MPDICFSTIYFQPYGKEGQAIFSLSRGELNKQLVIAAEAAGANFYFDERIEDIDFEKNSLHVMEKVFNYGTWKDQVAIMKFYGLQRIRKEIIHAGYLRKPVLSFLCAILQLQKNDFTCYIKMQSHPMPWIY